MECRYYDLISIPRFHNDISICNVTYRYIVILCENIDISLLNSNIDIFSIFDVKLLEMPNIELSMLITVVSISKTYIFQIFNTNGTKIQKFLSLNFLFHDPMKVNKI